MRNIKLILRYDGKTYSGWQAQRDRRTVQGTVTETLEKITCQPVRLFGSSRTDAGVHAYGQVANFHTETHLTCDVLRQAANAELPKDIQVVDVAEVPESFHAISNAIRKRYRYVLDDGNPGDLFRRNYTWHVRSKLNVEAMHRGAQHLLGKHDFRSFETHYPNRTTSVRTILDIEARRADDEQGSFVHVEVEADGFLYNMVRTIVGTLVDVGLGRQEEIWPAEVLAALDRSAAGMTAPPQGLFLLWIDYGEGAGQGG